MQDNYTILVQAQEVETGRIFESGEESLVVASFLEILQYPDAPERFLKIFHESHSDVGKIYALMGLYQFDKKEFDHLVLELTETNTIPVRWFGVIKDQTIAEMVAKIRSGELMAALQWKAK